MRLVAPKRTLAAERAALHREREALASERSATGTERTTLAAELAALHGEREALAGEREDLASERSALITERAALAAERAASHREREALESEWSAVDTERAALAAEIQSVREDATRQVNAFKDAKELVEAEFDDTLNRLAFERDILAMRYGGLGPLLVDESIPQQRRLAICEHAIAEGRLVELVSLLESIRADRGQDPMAARGLSLCNQLLESGLLRDLGWTPPTGAGNLQPVTRPFRFSPPDARDVLLVFLGVGHRFWTQIAALHPFLSPLDVHVVYLTDMQFSSFLRGIDFLGNTYEASVTGLRQLCRALGGSQSQIYCYGSSMGGFGALRYGLDLGARKVLAIETATSMKGNVCRSQDEAWLAKKLGALAVDLKPLYMEHSSRPPVTLYYGMLNERDTAHAKRFAEIPDARVIAVADSADHDCFGKLVAAERFPEILAEFLSR